LLLACASSEKYLQKGQYDRAIDKSVKKLRKDPGNDKELYVLKEAYGKAQDFDKDRIDFLEKEGREENYVEMYDLYVRMNNRQNKLKTLPSSVLREFTLVDYDDRLIASKEQAAEVSYALGIDYLERGGRENARRAYREFQTTKSIYSNYKDVDAKLSQARYEGTNQVLFVIENNSESVLPVRFDEELRKIGLADLNDTWIQYSVYEDEQVDYDYFVVLNIRDIIVSPEQITKEKYTDSKEIQDGTKYVLDENGNVKKDSLGNDIREPNFITIEAEVTETRQYKEGIVGGTIEYVNIKSDQLEKREDISVTAFFEHFSATASGDKRALSKESQDRVEVNTLTFPSNESLLMDAADLLKDKTKEVMYRNRGLLSTVNQ
jgi:tetratricopeptide (TPR) repeat protein